MTRPGHAPAASCKSHTARSCMMYTLPDAPLSMPCVCTMWGWELSSRHNCRLHGISITGEVQKQDLSSKTSVSWDHHLEGSEGNLLLQFRLVWLVFVQLQCTSQQGAGHPLGLAPPQRCPGRLPGFWLQLEPGFLQVRKFRGRFVR